MKLLTKTNRVYLSFSVGIYLLTALAFYAIIKLVIYDEVESRLLVEKRDFEAYIQAHNSWQGGYFVENKISVIPVTNALPTEDFKDTLILNRYDHELVPFRELTYYTRINGQAHRVSIRKSLIQSYRLIEVITVSMVAFLSLLFLCSFWFQSRLSGQLWQPFYNTLAKVRKFDLSSSTPLHLPAEEITEFNELNDVLQKMSEKLHQDYQSLKEFTENASHEIQTPLALINARVEQLIQSETLTESQSYWLDEIYRASRRMSKLNQGLLLLAKIENRQFADVDLVDLYVLITEKLYDMEEILQHKQLRVFTKGTATFPRMLPVTLADVLLSNLVSNAIKHNVTGGLIRIESTTDQLCISNTGPAPTIAPDRLFERFKKGRDATSCVSATPHDDRSVSPAPHDKEGIEKNGEGDAKYCVSTTTTNNTEENAPKHYVPTNSIGLGLAIVKQIGDSYGLTISYTYAEGEHRICLR